MAARGLVNGRGPQGDCRSQPAMTLRFFWNGLHCRSSSNGRLQAQAGAVEWASVRRALAHAVVSADHVARHVLVRHRRAVRRLARLVLGLDGLLYRRGLLALRGDDTVVRLARELPVLHAVHAVVAAHGGPDSRVADSREFRL